MGKIIKIDFYLVTMPDATKFDDVLSTVCKTPCDGKRNVDINYSPIRLQEDGKLVGDFCAGDMIRIQMDEFPTDAGLDGTAKRIAPEQNHGIGHETAFLYHRPWNILLMQRNRSAVSPSGLARYIEDRGGIDSPVQLDPVPLKSASQKLNAFKKFRKVRIRIAKTGRIKPADEEDASASDVLKLLEIMATPKTSNPVVDLTLGIEGPRSDSLKRANVLSTIRSVLRIPASEATIERLDISASDTEEGKLELLHYLDFVLTDQQPVTSEDRGIPYHQCAAALMASFKKNKSTLQAMYGKLEAAK